MNKKSSQFLSLGNENLSVALLAVVNISCRVLYCHFDSRAPQTGWALHFVLQAIIQRDTLLTGEPCSICQTYHNMSVSLHFLKMFWEQKHLEMN